MEQPGTGIALLGLVKAPGSDLVSRTLPDPANALEDVFDDLALLRLNCWR